LSTAAGKIEHALKKQRLQLDSQRLREQATTHASGLAPAFTAAEKLRTGWHWLKAHPALPMGLAVALIVARPAVAWRWGRRAWLGWKTWQRLRSRIDGVDMQALQNPPP
jgi:hypothetical protein